MGTADQTSKVYLGLLTKPYRFVVEDRLSGTLSLYQRHAPGSLRQLLLELFKVLSEARPGFIATLAQLDDQRFMKTRQQRRFVSADRSLIYIGSPHLTERHTVQVNGYWVATNLSSTDTLSVAKLACEAAGIPHASVSKLQL